MAAGHAGFYLLIFLNEYSNTRIFTCILNVSIGFWIQSTAFAIHVLVVFRWESDCRFIKDKARPLQFGGWGRACKCMQLHYYLEGGGRDSKDVFVRRN